MSKSKLGFNLSKIKEIFKIERKAVGLLFVKYRNVLGHLVDNNIIGLILSSRNVRSKQLLHQQPKQRKALTFIWEFGHSSFQTSVKIFDSRMFLMLCYGSEIWGYQYWHDIERTQVDFCKFVLVLGRSTSSAAALGKYGRLLTAAHYHEKCHQTLLKTDHEWSWRTYLQMFNFDILKTISK